MTGRGGKNYMHNPSKNPSVSIGISLSISPKQYNPSAQTPVYLILTAHILKSSQPNKPVTLATWNNPFESLSNRSFSTITCTSHDEAKARKAIRIWPVSHWPKYGPRDLDVRAFWDFITLKPDQSLEIRHEVLREKIDSAGVELGEVYKAEVTDLGLGTSWWMFGAVDEVQDKRFMRWSPRGVEGEKRYQLDNVDVLGEPSEDQMWENSEEWVMGEDPRELEIVLEKSAASFEIV